LKIFLFDKLNLNFSYQRCNFELYQLAAFIWWPAWHLENVTTVKERNMNSPISKYYEAFEKFRAINPAMPLQQVQTFYMSARAKIVMTSYP
jgi:hypothetical protein